ncbi:hypothetical protein FHR92_003158 [Fontibacillus solani]|uniref:Uncharacterized protein n=1 Tax=Fontibacillus solani TaxID=1572857 RepID=A0A7W3SVE9_9BACL|nr:hypothetical protein [Fontibacillus solani]
MPVTPADLEAPAIIYSALLIFVKSVENSLHESSQKLRKLECVKFHRSPSPSFSCFTHSLCSEPFTRVYSPQKKGYMRTLLM